MIKVSHTIDSKEVVAYDMISKIKQSCLILILAIGTKRPKVMIKPKKGLKGDCIMSKKLEELRVKVPTRLIKFFDENVPIIIKYHPAGLWPVDPGLLMEDRLRDLFKDNDFMENYEVVIMPRVGKL